LGMYLPVNDAHCREIYAQIITVILENP
jgi:hypothetical protein